MHSGLIGKVEKARRYAMERDRFEFRSLVMNVRGDNDSHDVTLSEDGFRCGCDFFSHNDTCAHTMAIERVLDGMLPARARNEEPALAG